MDLQKRSSEVREDFVSDDPQYNIIDYSERWTFRKCPLSKLSKVLLIDSKLYYGKS